MNIHNQLEDEVLRKVNEIFDDEEAKQSMQFCTCHQCRLDVACYVLNRISPIYTVSGRGLAHLESDYPDKLQREADIVSLIKDGIEHVSGAKRPHFPHNDEGEKELPEGPFFNFPQIVGRIFNSINFEPVFGISVSLFINGNIVKMVNPNWQNPYQIVANATGVYSFWPYPEPADAKGLEKEFELELAVDDPAYTPLRHYIKVTAESTEGFLQYSKGTRIYNVEDLYLIHEK